MNESKMQVIVVEPGKEAEIREIGSSLESLQEAVGGWIEAVYPYKDPVAIVCNEEGKLDGLPLNRALRDEDGYIYDVIAGTFLVVGLTEDNFGSLSDELAERYLECFRQPEVFLQEGERIIVLKTP